MNKQIEILKQQAGIDDNPDQEGLDLFAELIVLECARWLGNREFASPEALKQHFGVE